VSDKGSGPGGSRRACRISPAGTSHNKRAVPYLRHKRRLSDRRPLRGGQLSLLSRQSGAARVANETSSSRSRIGAAEAVCEGWCGSGKQEARIQWVQGSLLKER